MKVLVFLEQRQGKLKSSAKEALTVAMTLAGGDSSKVAGVMVGEGVTSLAAQAKGYGADVIYTAEHAQYKHYQVMDYTTALVAAVKEFSPEVVLGVASPMGRDLFARAAARLDAGLITDLIEIKTAGGQFSGGKKPMYAGKVIAEVAFEGSGLKMATIRPNVFAAKEAGGKGELKALAVSPDATSKLKAVSLRQGKSDKVDLTEATRIISGGRALGNAENFKVLADCAEVLGATVGASRAAVDAGYASHDMQVGQTGKTVNPTLYIACGISGSIQHMAGMRTAKVIVAINTDAEAPIFTVADYGLVGDLFTIVPALTQKLKSFLA